MSSFAISSSPRVAAIDLFCGAGGLSLGLRDSGVQIAAGIDLDPACRLPFEKNVRATFIQRDIVGLTGKDVTPLFGGAEIRVLAGCAPCQPFSGYTTRRRDADQRWKLLLEFLRLTEDVRPEIVTVENVPRLTHLELWTRFVEALYAAGYHVAWKVVDAADYGVPQHRRRLVLLGSRLGPIGMPPTRSAPMTTVREAIGDLPPVEAGVAAGDDPLHASRALTRINLARIRASRSAGTWREWPEHMLASCHRRATGRTYPSVYGRMSWNKPAPTITTQFYGFGNGRFGHPEQDRALTLREGAILQSFPDDFAFVAAGEPINFRQIGRLIGNAVPPRLARAIGDATMRHLGLEPEPFAATEV